MKRTLVSALSALALSVASLGAAVSIEQPATAQEELPWMNTNLSAKQRTELLLDAMTLD